MRQCQLLSYPPRLLLLRQWTLLRPFSLVDQPVCLHTILITGFTSANDTFLDPSMAVVFSFKVILLRIAQVTTIKMISCKASEIKQKYFPTTLDIFLRHEYLIFYLNAVDVLMMFELIFA